MIRVWATALGALAFAVARRWVATIMAATLCVVKLRLVTANLGMGKADPRAVVKLGSAAADVLVVRR